MYKPESKIAQEYIKKRKLTNETLKSFQIGFSGKFDELYRALKEQGLPDNFNNDEVVPMMNQNSGNVFLTNSDCQVAMMNGDKLEQFYFLSYHGHEGFADDLYSDFKNGNIGEEDFEQLAEILDDEGMTEEAEEVRSKIEE